MEKRFPYFSSYIFSKDAYPKKKPKAEILCRKCWKVFEGRYDDVAVVCPRCGEKFNPQSGPVQASKVTVDGEKIPIKKLVPENSIFKERMFAKLSLTRNGTKVYQEIDDFDTNLFLECEELLTSLDLPIPDARIRDGYNTQQILGYNYKRWRDLFNSRQLLSLGLLLKEISKIEDRSVMEQFLTLFASTLEYNNRLNSYKGEGTGAVRSIFSNHILKSERFYVENAVWANYKSSGTFNSLYNSRLIPAKKYLAEPFEIIPKAMRLSSKETKCLASRPLNNQLTESWTNLEGDANVLLFNTDSAHLKLPDSSVDAVVTDPPYFDYIHYSELSDFFYVWLAQILSDSYPGFSDNDSSKQGEVQNNNSEVFSELHGKVFKEANRVMKDQGTLVFSFHHSRPEGWMAIRKALIASGFEIVSVKPIVDDFGSASIKFQTKSPINLDAFIYAKKRTQLNMVNVQEVQSAVTFETENMVNSFSEEDIKLSQGDIFVIKSALLLKMFSGDESSEADEKARYMLAEYYDAANKN